ncbi:MAG: aldo/keto reductase, partial [Bacteroidota bacterium]
TDDKTSLRTIEKSVELGCNFFDTADVYGHGHSEILLGEALKGVRDKVYIATKVGADFYSGQSRINFSSEYIEFACDESLKRLRTDYIDLYQLHNPTLNMIRDETIFETMDRLREKGKIRFYGVSIHDPQEGIEAIALGKVDTVQVVYNIFSQTAAKELFPLAVEKNIGVIAREPLANGFLTGKYSKTSTFEEGDIRSYWPRSVIEARTSMAKTLKEFLSHDGHTLAQSALKFVLAQRAVSVVIAGAKTEGHVEENFATADVEDLGENQIAELVRVFRQ